MTKLLILSGLGIIKILNKFGYREVRKRGSHIWLECPMKAPVTVPEYRSVDRSLLRKILRDADISVDDFNKIRKQ